MIKTHLTILCLFAYTISVAQSAPSEQELLIDDLLLLTDNYVGPGAEAAALQSTAGWFSSARTLEKWQVEVSVHGNATFVPGTKKSKRSFNNDFSIIQMQETTTAELPTIFGGDTDVVFEGEIFGQEFTFDALEGLGKNVLTHPFPQVTVGLPYDTEISLRYLPSIMLNDEGFSTYGVGLKHSLSRYFSGANPDDFDFAAVVTYSNFKVEYTFTPADIQIAKLSSVNVEADLWLAQLIASKRYHPFEVFGALGLTISKFDYTLGGSGPALGLLNESLEGHTGNDNKFKGDIGLNYYFGNFKVSTMLTVGRFFNATFGLHYRI